MAVAAAPVGGNDQLLRSGVALVAHAKPPTPDGLYSECRGVMVRANAHPRFVMP